MEREAGRHVWDTVAALGHLERDQVLVAVSRWSVNAAFPTQQPLWLHVKRMTKLYKFAPRAPALPLDDLCLTVTRQCGQSRQSMWALAIARDRRSPIRCCLAT